VDVPETCYAKSGDLHIAYRVHGEGPFDIVAVPPWFWSIDSFGSQPQDLAALAGLGLTGRVIVFDKRGSGFSDPIVGAPTLEERMGDVRAVMDAVGSSSAALFGVGTDGGAMSMLFAATHPERTFALALLWALPRVAWAPDFEWGLHRLEYDQETQEVLASPIRGSMSDGTGEAIAAAGQEVDADRVREVKRLFRLSVSPGVLLAYRQMNFEIDVRPLLPAINVPTLLMYSDMPNERLAPGREVAEYLQARITGSELVAVPAADWLGNPPITWTNAALPALATFLPHTWAQRRARASEPERVLSTVLFTDLIASTAKAAELGPSWRTVLGEHNAVIRRQLVRFRGREIDTAGDGFFASGFDGPARAIRCACAIRDAVAALGLGIRIGLHTGECDIVDDKLSGLAVNIGARVAAEADEGEVLVSGTVKDLVAGSGITFEARGVRELKGVGEWPLYAVAQSD
jgi:class 3 adenylate cyclase/pimeloyl-ACP methyl ester carboxylesterase